VTEIGARMRFGLSPIVNVIGVIFMIFTILAAAVYVFLLRRKRAIR